MERVVISAPATRDIEAAYDWWRTNRSEEQAHRWYCAIYTAIQSFRQMPERYSFATESDLLSQGIRQLLFGMGRSVTHRIVFAIDDNTVIVLRVRHSSQDSLPSRDIER
jgi:plasmid stabilization system protein ParE